MIRGIALAAAVMAALASTPDAFGFSAEGFETDMTVDGVAAAVKANGLKLRPGGKGFVMSSKGWLSQYYAVRVDRSGNIEMGEPFINVVFCDGRLIGFSHNIDLDTDYITTLKYILDQHGNPGRVAVTTQTWSGPGGGYLSSSKMHWYVGDDRITLSFTPEGRTRAGAVRFSGNSTISYDTLAKECPIGDW